MQMNQKKEVMWTAAPRLKGPGRPQDCGSEFRTPCHRFNGCVLRPKEQLSQDPVTEEALRHGGKSGMKVADTAPFNLSHLVATHCAQQVLVVANRTVFPQ